MSLTKDGMVTGYRSAVRCGAMTPEQVLIKLDILKSDGFYIKPSIIKWLKKKQKERNQK